MSGLSKEQQRVLNVANANIQAKYGVTVEQIAAQHGDDYGKRALKLAIDEARVFLAMLDAANRPVILIAKEMPN